MRRAVMLVAALLTGCTADDGSTDDDPSASAGDDAPVEGSDFEVRYRTKYVDVAPGFTQPVCRGTLDEIDRHVETVAGLLDIDVQARFTWYWVNERAQGQLAPVDRCEWCSNCSACDRGAGTFYSGLDSAFHELVHSVVIPAWGTSDVLFNEGVAEAFNGSHVALCSLNSCTPTAYADQEAGPHFSRWLVDNYGPSRYRELFGPPLSESSTTQDVYEAVEDVYGMPFPELEAEYFATAPQVYPAPGLCDGLVHVPWQGNQWALYTTADYDAPHVFGPRDEDAAMVISVTLDLPDWPDVAWAAANEPDGIVTLTPCIEEPLYDVDDPNEAVRDRIAARRLQGSIPGGRYRLTFPVDEPGDVHLRLCPSNGEHPVAGEETTFDPCLPSG